MEEVWPKIKSLGASLLAVSPMDQAHTAEAKKELGLSYTLLADNGNVVAKRFGLVYAFPKAVQDAYTTLGVVLPEYNGENSWTLPIPAVFVVGKDGVVAWRYMDSNYSHRPEPSDVVAEVEKLV